MLALVGSALLLYLGLVASPPDVVQGQLVRLLYVHPPAATICYVAFGLSAMASLAYLWPRTRSRRWDALAGASAEIGVVFCGLTIITGSIWGKGAWSVWWTWDARLTLTALLFAVFLGYLALRRTGGDPDSRAKRCAIAAMLSFVVVPIDHYATYWWQTLHQGVTLFRPDPLIHGMQLVALLWSFVVYGLIFTWMLLHRYRVERLEDRMETEGFSAALLERRAEGGVTTVTSALAGAVPAGAVPAGIDPVDVTSDAAAPAPAGAACAPQAPSSDGMRSLQSPVSPVGPVIAPAKEVSPR